MQNAHGDVINLSDTDGELTKTYKYDAFGVEKNPNNSDTNPFRYCGEYFDKESGTIYLRARYYDPSIGRFISRDTFTGNNDDPLSLNLYTYCHNNPILYLDESGNWPKLSQILTAVAVVATVVAVTAVVVATAGAAAPAAALVGGGMVSSGAFVTGATTVAFASAKVAAVSAGAAAVSYGAETAISYAKERSKYPIGRRKHYTSKKDAKEAAKKAGNGKPPVHHTDGDKPHYHPDVPNSQRDTPHRPSSHDHYYYPKGK